MVAVHFSPESMSSAPASETRMVEWSMFRSTTRSSPDMRLVGLICLPTDDDVQCCVKARGKMSTVATPDRKTVGIGMTSNVSSIWHLSAAVIT